jgi:hypothetical protein
MGKKPIPKFKHDSLTCGIALTLLFNSSDSFKILQFLVEGTEALLLLIALGN